MDDQAVDKQITNMVSFIIQEAKEKASEIQTLANEEFTIQKAKLLQTEKLKVQRDFDRREKSILLQKKINHSTALNKARLEKLRAQQKEVQNVFAAARTRLPSLAAGEGYADLMSKLILQGLVSLDEADIVVRVRAEDVSLAQKVLPAAISEYKEKWLTDKSRKLSVNVDAQHTVKCSGGAVLTALDGRIICNNTLDMRLVYAYEVSLPRLRHTLFGQTTI
jgi:V-type H+-transporting ATPase subunit E